MVVIFGLYIAGIDLAGKNSMIFVLAAWATCVPAWMEYARRRDDHMERVEKEMRETRRVIEGLLRHMEARSRKELERELEEIGADNSIREHFRMRLSNEQFKFSKQ
jgi:hypothetical protein